MPTGYKFSAAPGLLLSVCVLPGVGVSYMWLEGTWEGKERFSSRQKLF